MDKVYVIINVSYIGDIWDMPCCSYESIYILKLMKLLANYINKKLNWESSLQYTQRKYEKIQNNRKIASYRIDPILRKCASYFILSIIFLIFIIFYTLLL